MATGGRNGGLINFLYNSSTAWYRMMIWSTGYTEVGIQTASKKKRCFAVMSLQSWARELRSAIPIYVRVGAHANSGPTAPARAACSAVRWTLV